MLFRSNTNKNNMLDVLPGILEQDFTQIRHKYSLVAGYVEWVHVDLVDGVLFDNTTFDDPEPFKKLKSPPQKELHMMVEHPQEIAEAWIKAGFDRLIAHIEGIQDAESFINSVSLQSSEVGLALDIDTPVSVIKDYIDIVDVVLLMAIETGFSGQGFDHRVLRKIHEVREINDLVPIEIDGGINRETAELAAEAGATRVVSTSYIFGSDNQEEAIRDLAKLG